ncbi:unnamed protein product [Orchesella dallaii]|uniref:C2H2-type domain-containing protein n=1 Tax=Orchesella dallaii TaxID=48710 RepID=A0ABP1RHF3_9HEXA
MDLEMGMKFCFVCCKRVQDQDHPLTARHLVDERDGERSLSSSSRIYSKFVEFAKSYLQLGTTEADRDQDDSSSKVEAFCESCFDQLKQIFGLYEQYCELERLISSKFVELAKLMKESSRHGVRKDKTKPGIKELIASKCLEKDDMLATGSGEGRNLSSPEERFLAGDGDEDDYVGIDVDVKIEEVDSPDEEMVEIESTDKEKTELDSADEEEVEVEGEELTAEQTGDPLSLLASPKTTSAMSDEDFNSIYVPDSQSELDDSDDDDDSSRISIRDSQSECNDTDDDVNQRGNAERKRIVLSDVVKSMCNQVNQEYELVGSQAPEASALQALVYNRNVNISPSIPKLSADNKDSRETDKAPDTISIGNFVCNHCYKHFDTAQALYTHLLSHENQSTGQGTSCPFCYKKFVLPQTHQLHMQIHHPSITATEKPFTCDGKRCTSSFKTLSELNEHISKHSRDILLECSVCQWGFIDSHHLKVHEILHTEPRNREYHCTACKCRFQRVMELQIHFNFKHGPSVGLQPMNEEVHVEEPIIVMKMKQICPHCKEDIPIEENLTLHSKKCILNPKNLVNYKTAAGTATKKARCHKCDKWIKYKCIKPHLIFHSFKEKLEKERVEDEYSSSSESSGDEEDGKGPETNSTSNLTCSQCKVEFPHAKGLHTHLLWHEKQSGEKGIPCCFCYKTFVLPQTQQLHMEVKHPLHFTTEKPFVCDEKDCNSSFERLSELNEHVATHSKPISYCSFCQWGFVCPYRRKLHELFHTQRKQRGLYYCSICNRRVPSMRELQIHYDFRHGTKSGLVDLFECCKCSKRFFMKVSLRNHMLKKHKKKLTKKYQCEHCKLGFRLEKTLIAHSETCLKNPKNWIFTENRAGKLVKMVRCNTCGKFVRPFSMQTHLASHKEIDESQKERQRVTCETCGSSFANYQVLQRHVDVIHKKIISRAQCEFCGKVYGLKSQLKKHVDSVHKGVDLTVVCDVCGKVFSSQTHLRRHMKVHGERKKYACHLCDVTVLSNKYLKKHLVNRHGKAVGEEFTPGEGLKFGCMFSSCGAKFGTDVELQQHVERNHAPVVDSKFMCTLCGRVFSNQARLTRHNLVHSKEKRLECHVCKKRFAYNSSLKDHLKVVHDLGEGQKYFRCEQPNCKAKYKLLNLLNKHVRVTHAGVGKDVANITNEMVIC